MTRAQLLNLAARVESFAVDLTRPETPEERALADEVLLAFGWVFDSGTSETYPSVWFDPSQVMHDPLYIPNPLRSIDAADAGRPKGWLVDLVIRQQSGVLRCLIYSGLDWANGFSTTEAQARAAANLRARAQDAV